VINVKSQEFLGLALLVAMLWKNVERGLIYTLPYTLPVADYYQSCQRSSPAAS
jgi:hypothetical protein